MITDTLPRLGCFFTGPVDVHGEHEWTSKGERVFCYGLTEGEARDMRKAKARDALTLAWKRAGAENARSVSTTVQLAVVDYCAQAACAVPTLDDMSAVGALVASLAR